MSGGSGDDWDRILPFTIISFGAHSLIPFSVFIRDEPLFLPAGRRVRPSSAALALVSGGSSHVTKPRFVTTEARCMEGYGTT
jgi:hypothetical protein